jgi:hypothetical protein
MFRLVVNTVTAMLYKVDQRFAFVVPFGNSRFWYSLIYLLAAIVLTPGGSSTVHIYTQTPGGSSTVHIYTQTPGGSSTVHIYTNQYREQHN